MKKGKTKDKGRDKGGSQFVGIGLKMGVGDGFDLSKVSMYLTFLLLSIVPYLH